MVKKIFLLCIICASYFTKAATFTIINPILCHGDSAAVEIIGTSGFPPYTNAGISNFAAGAHIVIVTDSLLNMDTVMFTITQPTPVSLNASVISGTLLCSTDSAKVVIEKYGGVGFNSIIDTFKMLGGLQIISATDTNNCVGYDTIYIPTPAPLQGNIFVVQAILCNGDTATINLGATGGTPPYTNTINYTYVAGNYLNYVKDANNCMDSFAVNITQPAALNVSVISTVDTGGNSGSATFTITGGTPPYKLFIDSVLKTNTSVTNLKFGNYNYYVVDSNLCITKGPLEIKLKYAANNTDLVMHTNAYVFPNPIVNKNATIFLNQQIDNNFSLRIYDVNAQPIHEENYAWQAINKNSISINCKNIGSGFYVLVLKTDKGFQQLKFSVL